MKCPFHPACNANLEPSDPGTSSITLVYPAHAIEGKNSWYGRCPASLMWVTRRGDVHQREQARLAEAWDLFTRRKIERVREELAERAERDRRGELRAVPDPQSEEDEAREAAEFDAFAERAARAVEERNRRRRHREPDMPIAREGLDDQTISEILDDDSHRLVDRDASDADYRVRESDGDDESGRYFRRGPVPEPGVPLGRGKTRPDDEYPTGAELDEEIADPPTPSEIIDFEHGGVSLGAGPDRPVDEFYPGRPADAPEPGPGEPPAAFVPLNIGGEHLGRAAVDNARDQLRGLLAAVIEQSGQGQDTLAKATAMTDSIEAYRIAAEQAVESASSLAAVAVGQDSGVPQAAHDMQAALLVCKDRLTAQGGELNAALARVRELIADVHRELGVAAKAAQDYAAQV